VLLQAITTTHTVWTAVHGLFNDNKKTREVYPATEFRHDKQGVLYVSDYLNRQKAMDNSLVEVSARSLTPTLSPTSLRASMSTSTPLPTAPLFSHHSLLSQLLQHAAPVG
jgi:hypothetical protein